MGYHIHRVCDLLLHVYRITVVCVYGCMCIWYFIYYNSKSYTVYVVAHIHTVYGLLLCVCMVVCVCVCVWLYVSMVYRCMCMWVTVCCVCIWVVCVYSLPLVVCVYGVQLYVYIVV